jgi:predicted nucleic acid-binding protein
MYIDTSALVKLYVEEPDSETCEAITFGVTLVSSQLLRCEFRSAILGKERRGIISADLRADLLGEFERDVESRNLVLIPLDDVVVHNATEILSEIYPQVSLRTLDALHLATYLSIDAGRLFTKDKRMREAARHLQVSLAD